ncbi:NAD(P)-dependent oxidoreductase [Arsenicitalea aurantiaca]|uniref:NAD(P)-dependent oxidoreductase n=1 Tax=Arsenicitalea aurantiaca TaxID=1783274 RepID=A0A433XB81_9HYPH|nr:NAD(P)-dependent oxidoreductase [Arsenicitalea aurantiaca]RUT31290.1 NAD(P)-dependent oxidoreductase [Arsenicitalea aurantiaca]
MAAILITGAAGTLGTHLRARFAGAGRDYVATDIRRPADGEDMTLADLSDRAAVDALMARDIAAVVHFGGEAKEAGWETILNANIRGTYNVFDAARKAGVGRVVFASSYHVIGMYPAGAEPLGLDADPRPDSLYGVSKLFGENLASLYFHKFGVQSLSIRICAAGSPKTTRECRVWCNKDDLSDLIERALDVPELGCKTLFGISANDGAWFSNPPGETLGWVPRHNSRELGLPYCDAPLDPDAPQNRWLGGGFPTWPHMDD